MNKFGRTKSSHWPNIPLTISQSATLEIHTWYHTKKKNLPGTMAINIPQTTSETPTIFLYIWGLGLKPVKAANGNTLADLIKVFL